MKYKPVIITRREAVGPITCGISVPQTFLDEHEVTNEEFYELASRLIKTTCAYCAWVVGTMRIKKRSLANGEDDDEALDDNQPRNESAGAG